MAVQTAALLSINTAAGVAVQIDVDAFGNVKGTVANSQADPPVQPDGKLNVDAAVNRGVLAVVRITPPYSGVVPSPQVYFH